MLKQLLGFAVIASFAVIPATAQSASDIAKVRNGKSCAGCNLFQAELAYQDVGKADLSKARLRQSNLALTTFDDVNLSGANLSIANLFGARFNRGNFARANMQNVIAVGHLFWFLQSDWRRLERGQSIWSRSDDRKRADATATQPCLRRPQYPPPERKNGPSLLSVCQSET